MKCDKCQWASWRRTPKGRIAKGVAGRCTYRVEIPKMPMAVKDNTYFRGGDIHIFNTKQGIWPGHEVVCETFERLAE